jgi:hypothetical protein
MSSSSLQQKRRAARSEKEEEGEEKGNKRKKKTHKKKKNCSYCGEPADKLKGTPFLADVELGSEICRDCWNNTKREYWNCMQMWIGEWDQEKCYHPDKCEKGDTEPKDGWFYKDDGTDDMYWEQEEKAEGEGKNEAAGDSTSGTAKPLG